MWVNFVCLGFFFGLGIFFGSAILGARVHNGKDYMGASSRHGDWSEKLRNKTKQKKTNKQRNHKAENNPEHLCFEMLQSFTLLGGTWSPVRQVLSTVLPLQLLLYSPTHPAVFHGLSLWGLDYRAFFAL